MDTLEAHEDAAATPALGNRELMRDRDGLVLGEVVALLQELPRHAERLPAGGCERRIARGVGRLGVDAPLPVEENLAALQSRLPRWDRSIANGPEAPRPGRDHALRLKAAVLRRHDEVLGLGHIGQHISGESVRPPFIRDH